MKNATVVSTPSGFTPANRRAAITILNQVARTGIVILLACLCLSAHAQERPAGTDVMMSQVNWLANYPNGGLWGAPMWAGSSFAVNSANGNIVFSTTWGGSIEMLNPQTEVLTTLGTYSDSGGLTLDSNNNLYIVGQYSPIVLKVPFINGAYVSFEDPAPLGYTPPGYPLPPNCTGSDTAACVVAPLTNLNSNGEATLAFDSQGDIFMATTNNSVVINDLSNSIYECTAACLQNTASSPAPVLLFQEPAGASPTTTGQLSVGGMAIDPWGNLFFTDSNLIIPNPISSGQNPPSSFSDLNELSYTGSGATGYAATPNVLYTETIASPNGFDDEIDGVAVDSKGTVYVADQYNGIFAFPNQGADLTEASVASSMYTLSTQGFGLLTLDAQGNLYGAAWAWADSSGTNTLAKIAVNKLTAPSTPVGVAATNSATLNPITTILNDGECASGETAGIASSTTEFSAETTTGCATTLTGASAFPTAVTFTPDAVGLRSATLTATDSDGNTGTATVSGVGLFTASAPAGGTLCNGAYNGVFNGNLKVSAGQICIFVDGGVTGNIQQSGGTLELIQSTVGGNLQVTGGGMFTVTSGSVIEGNLQVQNIPAGSATNQVCGSTVSGNLQFQGNGTAVLIGAAAPASCPGNVVDGNLTLQSNTAPATVDGNTVKGNLTAQSNTAATTIDDNGVKGNLTVQSNTAATTVDGNTVSGNLQDQSNTAATQVFSNVVDGNLQCQGNTNISGSGNTAKSKQQQCSAF